MTSAIETAIEASRAADKKVREGFGCQSDESLRALADDVGLITNPSLHIAASVAAELLRRRRRERAFREALAVAVEGLHRCHDGAQGPGVWCAGSTCTVCVALARIEAILRGEK